MTQPIAKPWLPQYLRSGTWLTSGASCRPQALSEALSAITGRLRCGCSAKGPCSLGELLDRVGEWYRLGKHLREGVERRKPRVSAQMAAAQRRSAAR